MARIALLVLTLLAGSARAADPNLAAYRADGSRLLWWLHLTDTHVDTFLNGGEEDRLRWAVSEGVTSIQPDFVVVTGDATDGTNGIFYSGANQAEWDLYRSIVDAAGLNDPGYYFDLPGNHDAYSDGGLALFRKNSVQGQATGRTQAEWRVDRPWGSTCFVGVATPQEGGQPWPMDPTELTAAELAETEAFLVGNPQCRVTVALGHHDAREVDGADGFRALCAAHGIGHYVHGHSHDYVLSYDGQAPLVLRTNSLGQGDDHQVTVLALDHDALSWESVAADDPWPLAVVTAPARGRFQTGTSWGNPEYLELPYAPAVPRSCGQAPVRALLFDGAPVTAASFRLDDGAWSPLSQRVDVPAQWRGSFDATVLAPGWHALTVQATGTKQRSFEVQVQVVDGPCEVGEEDPDGGSGIEPEPGAETAESAESVEAAGPEPGVEVAEVVEPEPFVEVVEPDVATPPDAGESTEPWPDEGGPAVDAAADLRAPDPTGPDAVGAPDTGASESGAADVATSDVGAIDVTPAQDGHAAAAVERVPEVDAAGDGDGVSGASGCAAGGRRPSGAATLLVLAGVAWALRRRGRGAATAP